MAVPAAGSAGLRDKITSLKDKITTAVAGENKDGEKYSAEKLINKLLHYAEEKCREKGIEPSEAIDLVMSLITNEEGKIDFSTVFSLINMLSGESSGGDSTYMQEMDNRNKTINAYVINKYKDTLEPGDLQTIGMISILNEEYDTRKTVAYISLANYTVEGKDLKQKNFANSVEYLEFDVDENLNFTVSEAIPAEEGENYSASIDALCERLGVERARFDSACSQLEIEWEETYEMMDLLETHPEYERIEYQGEMKTIDEMRAINGALFDQSWDEQFASQEE